MFVCVSDGNLVRKECVKSGYTTKVVVVVIGFDHHNQSQLWLLFFHLHLFFVSPYGCD